MSRVKILQRTCSAIVCYRAEVCYLSVGSGEAAVSEPARLDHATWQRRGGLAGAGASAAAETPDNRLLGLWYSASPAQMGRSFRPEIARTRLDRGSQCGSRISMG